jgi:hypothetical protein
MPNIIMVQKSQQVPLRALRQSIASAGNSAIALLKQSNPRRIVAEQGNCVISASVINDQDLVRENRLREDCGQSGLDSPG